MISIIVYGRNDAYGYNLHKRAAISLNCLAHLLDGPDDELIFTDYNTADDAPTFPEAIADTLTPRARSRLRILRVRPSIHSRFAQATSLPLIEAVARNVALRRSNPANRWILSTNTDIVLVPRQHRNLNEIAQSLSSGFYHTARFEIPESIWEGFDRAAPAQIIDEVRGIGRAARLNEVVYGSPLILYDGPGDFQFVQRRDLFAIDGFDERMVHAWHVDSNLAKRLGLRQGAPVSSLLNYVYCYHCDHTRRAGPAHTLGTPQNEQARFVDQIAEAGLPLQRDDWGCSHDDIEEIRISENPSRLYTKLIGSLVGPLDTDVTEAFYTPDSYDHYSYDPGHVIPFIVDLLQSYPRDTRLAWCGVRRDTFELIVKAWRELGFRHCIAVHPAIAHFFGADLAVQDAAEAVAAWLADADLLAFEFGRLSEVGKNKSRTNANRLIDDDAEAISIVQTVFLSAVADERSRLTAKSTMRRRFVGINCIHNRSEGLFAAHIDAALAPFSSRLRHGFLSDTADDGDGEAILRVDIGRELARPGAATRAELALAHRLFAPLLQCAVIAPEHQHQIGLNAALGRAYLIAVGKNKKLEPHIVDGAVARLDQLRASAGLAKKIAFPVVSRPLLTLAERPLSRFIQYEDWDEPAWSIYADEFLTERVREPGCERECARWEQAQLVYGLDRSGILNNTSRILVVATMPDAVIGVLSRRAGVVNVIGLTHSVRSDVREARSFWSDRSPYVPHVLNIYSDVSEVEKSAGAYDAVVFPHGAMFADGLVGALRWMSLAETVLRPGGVFAFKAEVISGDMKSSQFFDPCLVGKEGLADQLKEYSTFVVNGGFDPSLTQATVDRTEPELGSALPEESYFIGRRNGCLLIPSMWFLEKHGEIDNSRWDRIRSWVLDRLLGEQLPSLHIGSAGRRNADGSISALVDMPGHVCYGPYLAMHSGRYRVSLSFAPEGGLPRARSQVGRLEVVVDDTVIATKAIASTGATAARVTREFEVPRSADSAALSTLELRVFSTGDAPVRYTGVRLEAVAEGRERTALGSLFRWGKFNSRGK